MTNYTIHDLFDLSCCLFWGKDLLHLGTSLCLCTFLGGWGGTCSPPDWSWARHQWSSATTFWVHYVQYTYIQYIQYIHTAYLEKLVHFSHPVFTACATCLPSHHCDIIFSLLPPFIQVSWTWEQLISLSSFVSIRPRGVVNGMRGGGGPMCNSFRGTARRGAAGRAVDASSNKHPTVDEPPEKVCSGWAAHNLPPPRVPRLRVPGAGVGCPASGRFLQALGS